MSKFYNLEGQSVVVEAALDDLRPVHEGWGEAIGNLVSMLVPAAAGAIGGKLLGEKIGKGGLFGAFLGGFGAQLLGMIAGTTGLILFNAATAKKFMKIIEHPKVKEYLLQEADKIYKEVKKADKSVVTKWDDKDKDLEKAAEKGELNVPGFMSCIKYMKDAEIEVGQYSILLMGDSQELKRIVLVLYSNNAYHLILKDIAVPSKEQVNEWLKEEAPAKESMEVAEEGWFTVFQTVLQGVQRGFVGGVEKVQAFDAKFEAQLVEKFNKVLENDLVKNHIKTEADKLFAEEKKTHKKLVKDVSDASTLEKEFDAEAKGQVKAYSVKKATHYLLRKSGKVGEYTVILLADPDSKKALKIKVVFFDPAENKYITRDIAAPNA